MDSTLDQIADLDQQIAQLQSLRERLLEEYASARLEEYPFPLSHYQALSRRFVQTSSGEEPSAARQLLLRQEQLHKLFNSIPGAVLQYCLHPDGTESLPYISDQVITLWGFTPEEAMAEVGKLWEPILPEDTAGMQASIQLSAQAMTPWMHSWRIRTPEGQIRWLQGRGHPHALEDGTVMWDTLILDATELKEKEASLARLNERMKIATDSAGIGIWDLDLVDNRLVWDDWMFRLYGITSEDFDGTAASWEMSLHPDDLAAAKQTFEVATQSLGNYNTEFRILRPDGEVRYLKADSYVQRDAQGNPVRVIGTNYDITERRRVLEELEAAKEKAEASNRLKSAFLANMSHELRTPMNGILGFMELLRESRLDQATREEYVDIVNRSGKRLLNTINNIISISEIESGTAQLRLQPIDLCEMLQNLYSFFQPQAQQKGLTLHWQCDPPAKEQQLQSDPAKLESIFTNLISNAIKFTDAGEIHLQCQLEGHHVCVYVNDTGIGIAAEQLDRIYDRFTQVDERPYRRAYEGSGLGLSIAQAYVQMLGGRLEVTSEPEAGTTFAVYLPQQPPSQTQAPPLPAKQASAAPPSPTPSASQPLKVLVAEDDDTNYKLVVHMLKQEPVVLIRARNGQEAVELVASHPDLHLVLMDVGLPVLSGVEATEQIRSNHPRLPIVAQTAYVLEEEREKLMQAGFDGFLPKPFNQATLKEKIYAYAQRDHQ